jgi:5'-methylthioadenosine phosphorylase
MKHEQVTTPFGPSDLEVWRGGPATTVILRPGSIDLSAGAQAARATIYGARQIGATRVLEIVAARPLDRLLPEDSYAIPHDLVDLTRGRYLTFFEGKGYGFLPQHTPFCPEMRGALVRATRAGDPAGAGRGIFAALDRWDDTDEARRWGAHLAGIAVSPTAFLARELELCYAPLCLLGVPRTSVDETIAKMIDHLPDERHCLCSTAMQATRERGMIGEEWRTWI